MTHEPSPPQSTDHSSEAIPPEVRAGAFIVIAAFNEGPAIADVASGVAGLYPNVVVVDDGSDDDTSEQAERGAKYVLRHAINRGQGAALQTGITFALRRGARFIVTFDADGQHRVEDIWPMIRPIHEGRCEITIGSRFLGSAVDLPSSRRVTLKAAVLFTRVFSRVKVTDAHNGFRAFSRDAASSINLTLDRMAHASEIIDQIRRSRLPFREVPVEIRYTDYSLAKGQSSRQAFRIAFQFLIGKVFR